MTTPMPIETINLTGHFLIAMPAMADPNFSKTVTYICEHNEKGALGVVVNRPTDMTLEGLFEQVDIPLESPRLRGLPVHYGGPVQVDRGFVLHDDPRPWPSTLRFGTFGLTSSREILHAMARGEGPERYLVMVGHAGWGGEQLEGELAQNAWLTVPAPEAMVFDTDSELLWQVAAGQIGVDMANMADYSGHA